MSGHLQNILVTGATRGLGLAIARRLASDGFHVIATGRKITPDLQDLSSSASLTFYPFDLQAHSEIHGFIRNVTGIHGHLRGLVNNAALGHDGLLATMHDSQIEELIAVNVTSTILLTKYAIRSMLLRGLAGGRVVNVSSIIAGTGFSGLSVYAASKAALNGFSRSLAREVGKAGITVNTLTPGYMQTDMTSALKGEKLAAIMRRSPLGRLATTADAAAAVAWLMSDEASSVTGTSITVDAGSTA
jgi:3-oxoacyl-[acyl-carrier protein] reductase